MKTAAKVIEELLKPFWKQEDLEEYSKAEKRLEELDGKYTPRDNSPEDQEAYSLTWRKKNIEMRVSERYILTFSNDPERVFKDMQLILDAATKEEYLEHLALFVRFREAIKGTYENLEEEEKTASLGYYTMVNFLSQEGYKTCFLFLQGLIEDQISVVRHYIEKETPKGTYLDIRTAELIHRKTEKWYEKPADVNIYEPITSDISADIPIDLSKENFYKAVHGKPTDALAALNKKKADKNLINNLTVFDKDLNNQVQISCKNGDLGISAHKLLTKALSEFTSNNNNFKYLKKGEKPNRHVSFSLKEYARETGYKVDPRPTLTEEEEAIEKKKAKNALDNARKSIKSDLIALQSIVFTWEEYTKNLVGDGNFDNINLFSSSRYNKKTKYIEISFTEEIAEYLARRNTITNTPKALSKIDPRKSNVYSIGYKIYQHYDNYNNIIKGTNDRLGVKTLLKVTNLPSYEEVQEKDRGHWQNRIKEPFENALDELVRMNLLSDWRYVKAKAEELTEEEAYTITDYKTFSSLYVLFDPAEKINNQEQVERKKAEIAKNKEKKEKARQKALEKAELEKLKSGK